MISVTVSQHAQYQDPESEATKWNSAIINLIISTCADVQKCPFTASEYPLFVVGEHVGCFCCEIGRVYEKQTKGKQTDMLCCSQPYFRSSRASEWGCDPAGASGLPPPPPHPASCPHWAWLARTCTPPTPSWGPETDAKASDPADLGARSLPRPPPPPAPPRDLSPPSISVYSVAVCGTDSFSMDSLKPRRLENMCVSLLTRHLCVCVCVCVWRCDW